MWEPGAPIRYDRDPDGSAVRHHPDRFKTSSIERLATGSGATGDLLRVRRISTKSRTRRSGTVPATSYRRPSFISKAIPRMLIAVHLLEQRRSREPVRSRAATPRHGFLEG